MTNEHNNFKSSSEVYDVYFFQIVEGSPPEKLDIKSKIFFIPFYTFPNSAKKKPEKNTPVMFLKSYMGIEQLNVVFFSECDDKVNQV